MESSSAAKTPLEILPPLLKDCIMIILVKQNCLLLSYFFPVFFELVFLNFLSILLLELLALYILLTVQSAIEYYGILTICGKRAHFFIYVEKYIFSFEVAFSLLYHLPRMHINFLFTLLKNNQIIQNLDFFFEKFHVTSVMMKTSTCFASHRFYANALMM